MFAARVTLTVLGVGLLVSLVAGALYGLVIDDMGRGVGQAVAVGMAVTAIVGVAINVLWRAGRPGDDRRRV